MAHIEYFLKDGTRVPSVTTIIGRFKEADLLIKWAYNRGKNGLELYESRDKAAELGSIVHEMVEYFIRNEDPYVLLDGLNETDKLQVKSSFNAFREWFVINDFQIIVQEKSLVSEKYHFGGTLDAIAIDKMGRTILLDWKTSDGVYRDYLIQLAAYRLLWNENFPDNQLTGGNHLCRFAKSYGDFVHHFYPDLKDAEDAFRLMVRLYYLDKKLKKRC